MSSGQAKPRSNARRKPNPRPLLRGPVRVQRVVFEALEAMVAHTGMPANENAAMLLHMLMTDPDSVAARLKALRGQG